MTYDIPEHYYMTVIGDAYNQTERWQFGLRMTPPDPLTTLEAMALAASDVVQKWWGAQAPWTTPADSYYPCNTHRLTELKMAAIAADGSYSPGVNSYSHYYIPPQVGLQAPNAGTVPQDTFVATLLTDKPRGRGSKGRIFLPPSALMAPATDGLVSTTTATRVANGTWRLIMEINALPALGEVCVFSKGAGVKVENVERKRYEWTYPTAGEHHPVTGVKVGRVIDTQRRRRRQLVEGYRNDEI